MEEKVVLNLSLDDILPNRFQPRIKFDEEAITELSESIREHGVIQPIIVREIGNKYEIIAGERRYKASVMAGKETIPAIVNNLDDKKSAEIALIENVQRQDLTPIEEAVSYKKILDMGYLTQEELAEKIDKKQSTVSNKLRLLNLADEVQEALLNEEISERHARSLLKLSSPRDQVKMLNKIIEERLTVRKTDVEIKKILDESGEQYMNDEIIESEVKEENVFTPIKEATPSNINIPMEPIINDTAEELDVVDLIDIEEIKMDDYNFEPIKAPGFLDIDLIEKEAKDIIIEKPVADIEELLRGTVNSKETEEKISMNAFNSGKFFSFNQEDKKEEPVTQAETNFDFKPIEFTKPNIESKETVDFKVVMNTVRDCASKIENNGYKIETKEEEYENYYEITFRINKTNI